jgi:DNA-binding MarR family transcriptional regulator
VTETSLAFRIVNWIGIIDQLASTEANRVLRPLGLQLPQFVLLNHFSHRPEETKTVTSIARALQQPQPGVTKNVRKLVAKGWLRERSHGGDGRSKLLLFTAAGAAKHRAAVAALSPGLERAVAGWSDRERETLFALLDRLKVWFDRDRDGSPA